MIQTSTFKGYMNAEAVIDYVEGVLYKWNLSDIIRLVCKEHNVDGDICYSTRDLENVMMPDLYRKLQCEVTTYMMMC